MWGRDMRTVHITKDIFTFNELSDHAKDKVREMLTDDIDYEFLYEDFQRMGAILGIDIETKAVKLMNGKVRYDPCIYWSGFYHQGSSLAFNADYRYAKGAVQAMKAETNDSELIRIAQALQDAQRPHFYRLEAGIACHRGTDITVEVFDREDKLRDIGDAEDEIRDQIKEFAHWCWCSLRDEYEHQCSEEAISEACEANGYEFDERGNIQ